MKNRSIFWILLIALSLGCNQEKQTQPPQPITLGAIYNLTGGQAFRQVYMEAYDGEEPNAFGALGYDAARLLIEAIEGSGTLSPEAIRQALTGIQNSPGVTGMISFDPDLRIPNQSVTIMEVQDRAQKLVTEIVPRKIPNP